MYFNVLDTTVLYMIEICYLVYKIYYIFPAEKNTDVNCDASFKTFLCMHIMMLAYKIDE